MSNSLFSSLFIVPAIPATIAGKNDVALSSGNVSAVVFGEGATPQVRGAALLSLIGGAAFNGGKFDCLPESPKGTATKIKAAILAACSAAPLPACKGGKTPRHLLASEVEAFVNAFAVALGEKVERAPAAVKLPDVAAFVEKHGKEKAHEFAVALLAACGGAVSAMLDAERAANAVADAAKRPAVTIKRTAAKRTAAAAAAAAAA